MARLTSPPTKRRSAASRPAPRGRSPAAMGDAFRVVTWEETDLSQALVVIGFPSVGLVGGIAATYLVKSLHLREVGYVLSPALPPAAVVHEGISASPIRVYLGDVVCGPDGSCDELCVVLSEIAPKPSLIPSLADALVSWAKEHRARQLVCLEGLKLEDASPEEARVLGVASDEAGRKMLEVMKIPHLPDGLVVGIGGVTLYVARAVGQPALCLLAKTREDFPDARGAASLLESLRPLVPHVAIDERPLYEQAQVFERVLRDKMARSNRAERDLAQPRDIMYG